MHFPRLIICVFMSLSLLCGCFNKPQNIAKTDIITENTVNIENNPDYVKNMPVYRCLAARMISIIFGNGGIDSSTKFTDVSFDQWYAPYINNVSKEGIMTGSGGLFNPNEPLTYRQAQIVLKKLGLNTADKNIKDKDVAVSYDLWCNMLFSAIADKLSDYGVEKKELSIFATAGEGETESWTVSTAEGLMKHGGLYMDSFVDKTIEVYTKNNEIIAVTKVSDNTCYISGAYVEKNNNKLTVLFNYGKRDLKTETENTDQSGIYDLSIKDGKIISAKKYEHLADVVLKYDKNKIELENGKIYDSDNIHMYEKSQNNICCTETKFLSGGSYDIYLKNQKVFSAVFNKKFSGKIRTLISRDNFDGYFHDKVTLSGNLKAENNGNIVFEGENAEISKDNAELFKYGNRIKISSDKKPIAITSLKRSFTVGHPSYTGTVEIEKTENGLLIVNETDIESYVKGVLPSEMPESYSIEALKAQAVCARSYGYNSFFSGKYTSYGADNDDSVMCQVYNNIPYGKKTAMAVDETKGKYLFYNTEIVNTSFFASSAGTTANSDEIWIDSKTHDFTSPRKEYLSARNNTGVDFSDEKSALLYFKNTNAFAYDSFSKWFRWNVSLTSDDIKNIFIQNIKPVYDRGLVKIHSGNISHSDFMTNPKSLTNIEVIKRGEGGNIMILRLTFETGSADIYTEYAIRSVLRPKLGNKKIILNLKDSSTVENYSLMPSAYFSFEKNYNSEGKLSGIKLYGGGMGHGCGMSQNGAEYLASQGKSFEEILKTYYKNTEIR